MSPMVIKGDSRMQLAKTSTNSNQRREKGAVLPQKTKLIDYLTGFEPIERFT